MLTPKDAILFKIVRTCAMTPKAAILFKIVHTCAKECLILKYKYVQNPCCNFYVIMLWWRHEHGAVKFPKTWRGTLGYRPKIHHFFFSHKWDTRFKYLSKLCPYILMYSALHIMQWFSHSLDVFTSKIKRKFFDFYILWIKTNVAYLTWDDR